MTNRIKKKDFEHVVSCGHWKFQKPLRCLMKYKLFCKLFFFQVRVMMLQKRQSDHGSKQDFWLCYPNMHLLILVIQIKSLHLKDEYCIRMKFSKILMTGLAAANSKCRKLLVFIMGKAKFSACYKNFGLFSCYYRRQKGSWIDLDLFKE